MEGEKEKQMEGKGDKLCDCVVKCTAKRHLARGVNLDSVIKAADGKFLFGKQGLSLVWLCGATAHLESHPVCSYAL